MLSINEKNIREAFVNASRKEVTDITLPAGFAAIDWHKLDYLGWRDPKIARRSYVVAPVADGFVGVILRQAEAGPRSRAQCSWCQDITLPNDVVFYAARKSGAAGRKGDTVATLICQNFECSKNVRMLPPVAYLGYDVEAARLERIATLQERAAAFAALVAASD